MLLFKRERLLPGIQKRVLISSVCSYFSQVQNNNDDFNDNDDDDDDDDDDNDDDDYDDNADRSKKTYTLFWSKLKQKVQKIYLMLPSDVAKATFGQIQNRNQAYFYKR